MQATEKRSHHAAAVRKACPVHAPLVDDIYWDPLSRAAVLVAAAVWMRVDGPHRSAAERPAAHALLCAVLESGITCARSTITSVAAPPP
jgi:hypothetical protein